ncbi:MAG: hypothetical protein GVY18_18755 [Bacteroidetes bacterium]|jgi:hypothetical protein|nr:hypothetical protein [Bacteroidota bacterium]
MWRLFITLGVGLCLVLGGCASGEAPRTPTGAQQPDLDSEAPSNLDDIMSGVGTVRYIDLEGGFYGIEAEDGAKYLPQNLAEDYQQDGMRVRFRVQILEDVMTTQMWGQPVRVLNILEVTVEEDD